MRERAVKLGRKILTHELVTGSTVVFLGSTLANIFGFIFNLFLVRQLTSIDYGEYTALLSLIVLISIPGQSFIQVIVQFVSRYFAKKDLQRVREFYFQTFRFFTFTSFIVFLLFLVFQPFIKGFFHIRTSLPIIISGLTVMVMYFGIPNVAFVQSLMKFGYLSAYYMLTGVLKVIFGVLLVMLGWKTNGALGAIFMASFIPILFAYIPLKDVLRFTKQKSIALEIKDIFTYSFPTALSLFALSSFTSTDILLVKHFFSAHDAGLYAGLSLVGKIIFYFTAPITTVMFPLVIKRFEEKRNYHNLFFAALALVSLPSVTLTLVYFLFPHIVVLIFLGGRQYQNIAGLLGYFGIFLTLFSLLNVLVNFFLSLKKTEVSILVILGAVLQAVLISLYHATFYQIITISIIATLVLLILLLFYYFKNYASFKNE